MHSIQTLFPAILTRLFFLAVTLATVSCAPSASRDTAASGPQSRTAVAIVGEEFHINGRPTYEGRVWQGHKIQGLMMNSRMIQGIFDDLNPETRHRWKYPDTGEWDPERNTAEYIAAMPSWREKGLLNFSINLQGGSPEGYSGQQPWENNAFEPDGSLRPAFMDRLRRILDKADELGITAIVGYYYFGQDHRLQDEAAVVRGVDNATNWLLDQGYQHVLVEVNNECDNAKYTQAILKPDRVHELIERVKQHQRQGRRLLVSTSYVGGSLPGKEVIAASDYVLLHGNGVKDPDNIARLVRRVREQPTYTLKPILFNEDDHFEFDKPWNNCRAALSEYASWGYFDPGKNNYRDGYQSMPVDWRINTPLKQSFFDYVAEITGADVRSAASAQEQGPVFQEQNGLVVIGVEAAPPTGAWTKEQEVQGYTGGGYYEWKKGNTDLKIDPPGLGVLTYRVQINKPGLYHLQIRSAAPHPTDYNDVWVRLPDNGAFRQKEATGHTDPLGSGWFKMYQNKGGNRWTWDTHTKDHDHHEIFTEFPRAGVYRVELSGRSTQHKIDRLVLYDASVSATQAQDLNTPESPKIAAPAADLSRPFPGNPVIVTGERKKWHPITLTFNGSETSETDANNPFLNYRLNVVFSLPWKSYVVPGYYAADGEAAETGASTGNKWRVHFTPDEEGEWQYMASFRQGPDVAIAEEALAGSSTAFNGLSGTLVIGASDKTGADFRGKGKIQYVGEHYLRHQNGDYFLKGGADSPENFLAYEGFDSTYSHGQQSFIKSYSAHLPDWKPGDPTWRKGKGKGIIGALNYLAGKEMNSVYFLTMNVNGDGKDVWPWTAHTERERFDVSKLDQWEIVFSHMDRLGLMLHIVTQETENEMLLDNGDVGKHRSLYYRELIARFAHHLGITWNLGEENSTNRENPQGQNDRQRKAMASYFKKHDPYKSFVVIHTHPKFENREEVYTPLLGYPDFNGPSIQTEGVKEIHAETIKWLTRSAKAGVKWVVNQDEIGPANVGVKPDADDFWHDDVRKYALWGNLMAGGGGAEWYFGYEFPHHDLTAEDWRTRDNMWVLTRHALTFFRTHLPFPQMASHDALTSAKEAYCLAKPGEVYAVYLLNGGTTNLNLGKTSGTFTVQWFNPRLGGDLVSGTVTSLRGGGNRAIGFPPADPQQDWVALIRRQ
jgi:hypothetical protein